MKTAKLVKENLEGFKGQASLYKLSEKAKYDDDKTTNKTTSYVICSSVVAMFTGMETYIFPANKSGEVLDWGELDGSQRGTSSHEVVLKNAGYKLIK